MVGTRNCAVFSLSLLISIPASGVSPQVVLRPRARGAPPTARLAAGRKALMKIVVRQGAGRGVRGAATTLGEYLSKISGATFAVTEGDSSRGVVVGLAGDFRKLPFAVDPPTGPFAREWYTLRSSAHGLWLIGRTDMAVRHAVWDLLYRLGHRQFFPGQVWEVVPKHESPAIAVDATERPDFHARRIWYNWGTKWGYNRGLYEQWCTRNRARRGFRLYSGHAYDGIIVANRSRFDAHPEYFALIDGKRRPGDHAKFCIANRRLRALVAEHAVRHFKANPDVDSISIEPSDGGGWCQCKPCAAVGTPSDRALLLANEVAEGINALGLGDKYVGMYAYYEHAAPPKIRVHPKVIVSAATGLIRGGHSFRQILAGWAKQGATLGVYDYFSVVGWDWNQPLRAKAGRPHALASAVRSYYKQGARFLEAESGDSWGPYGLGYYVGARVAWDVDEADRVDRLIDDFLTRAFGLARKPMAVFYHLITADDTRRSARDRIGRMYRHLAAARKLAAERSDVRRRIDHLILYTRYVELYAAHKRAAGEEARKRRDDFVRFAYRIRKTMMVHSYGIWCRTVGQKAAHTANHPLKDDRQVTEQDILGFLKDGVTDKPASKGR